MSIRVLSNRLHAVSRYLRQIGNLALAAMMFLTTADVAGRYFFNKPVLGAFEVTEYLMLLVVFSFLAFAQAQKAHITVDILFNHLPYKIKVILDRLNHLICLLMMLLVAKMGIAQAFELKNNGEMSTLLKLPDYPFAIFMVLGCTALCIEFLIDVITPPKNKESL